MKHQIRREEFQCRSLDPLSKSNPSDRCHRSPSQLSSGIGNQTKWKLSDSIIIQDLKICYLYLFIGSELSDPMRFYQIPLVHKSLQQIAADCSAFCLIFLSRSVSSLRSRTSGRSKKNQRVGSLGSLQHLTMAGDSKSSIEHLESTP